MIPTSFYTANFVARYQNVFISMYFSKQLFEGRSAGDGAAVHGAPVCLAGLRPDFLSEASGRPDTLSWRNPSFRRKTGFATPHTPRPLVGV